MNVLQSAALSTPRLLAEAVGTFRVMTGVLVPVATVELRSDALVLVRVSAATLETVPPAAQDTVPLPLVERNLPLLPLWLGRKLVKGTQDRVPEDVEERSQPLESGFPRECSMV